MSAPDVPAAPVHTITERPLAVHLTPARVEPEALRDGVVIVIDALRASVTITAALQAGAAKVMPVLTVGDAMAVAEELEPGSFLLGGERGGKSIEGFDLDNSPASYTADRVARKTIVFTTTNGTSALLHADLADMIVVGSLANLSAVCEAVAHEPRAVHILCAGTRDEVSLDDCIPAGAMVERLVAAGRQLVADDSARLCAMAYHGAQLSGAGLAGAMKQSRGGRNLIRIGHESDVEFCCQVDWTKIVPIFDAGTGEILAD
jgi:2-phosphosulfolactate phosphatase